MLTMGLAPALGKAQAPDVISLPEAGWQYHAGDDAACAIGGVACAWRRGEFSELVNSGALVLWSHTEVALPPSLASAPQLSLSVEELPSPYEVFVNGHRVGGVGDMQKIRGPWCPEAVFSFPSSFASDGHLEIAIRDYLPFGNNLSGTKPFLLGTPAAVHATLSDDMLEDFSAQWQHYACFFVVFCVGAFFLFLYGFDRKSAEYMWLGIVLVGVPLRRFLELASIAHLGLSDTFGFALYSFLEVVLFLSNVSFPFAITRRPVWTIFRAVQAIMLVEFAPLLLLLPPSLVSTGALAAISHVVALSLSLGAAVTVVIPFTYLVAVPVCLRSPLPEMRWIGGALAFLFFEDFNRFVQQLSENTGLRIPSIPQVIPMGTLVFDVRAFAYLLFALVMLVAMTVRFRRIQSRSLLMEADLEAARTVQQILIPEEIPAIAGLTIESAYFPAQEVGGDFFQILPQANGTTLIVLGDVAGHGLPAAMTVSLLVGAIRTLAEQTQSPAAMLNSLNRRLFGRSTGFATCLALAISEEGVMTYANAGHLNPYLDGAELPTEPNLPLGLMADTAYEEASVRLGPAQHLTLLTDGVLEATDAQTKALFGFERMREISGQTAHQIAETARRFGQADDITVLSLTVATA
jgi:hypothetical protein